MSLLLAQSGHFETEFQCLLLGAKRTSAAGYSMSAFDPKRTSAGLRGYSLQPIPCYSLSPVVAAS
jgi:hypothetical protein